MDEWLRAESASVIRDVLIEFEACQTSRALQRTWELVRAVNQYIVRREPWSLAKDPAKRVLLECTLYHAADALRVIAALVDPIMPGAVVRIRAMLGTAQESWVALAPGALLPGTHLGPVEPLFPRIELTVEELRLMSNPESVPAPAAGEPAVLATTLPGPPAGGSEDGRISIDDFMKVELRVATVLAAEAVPKSKKLLKLQVDTGTDQRTVVAGIAEAYTPDELVGRTIVIVANLKPAKLMGIASNGMVLAASIEGGLPTLVSVENIAGAKVR